MHQFLRDAAFLDDRSAMLSARFITYNHPHETFCTIEIQIAQGRNGAFHGQVLLPRSGSASAATSGMGAQRSVGCITSDPLMSHTWCTLQCSVATLSTIMVPLDGTYSCLGM
jgi:hypothetical protein